MLQTPLYWWKEFDTYKFQSPYGGIGASDFVEITGGTTGENEFQSPYGGRGASDMKITAVKENGETFQSPYGGRGRSDKKNSVLMNGTLSFNHLTVAGVGQTSRRGF